MKGLHKHGVPEGKVQELLKDYSLWFGKSIREVIESHRRGPGWKRLLRQLRHLKKMLSGPSQGKRYQ